MYSLAESTPLYVKRVAEVSHTSMHYWSASILSAVCVSQISSNIQQLTARQHALTAQKEALLNTKAARLNPERDWATGCEWDAKALRILGEVFGLAGFRPLQKEAINCTLSGKDAVCLLPSGGASPASSYFHTATAIRHFHRLPTRRCVLAFQPNRLA